MGLKIYRIGFLLSIKLFKDGILHKKMAYVLHYNLL